jgi:cytochrome c553
MRALALTLSGLCAAGVLLGGSGRLFSAESAQPSAAQDLEAVLTAIPDMKRGAKLFALCAQCHGADGEGIAEAWTPAIAGQHARVLAKQLVAYRHSVRWDPRMEKVASRHVLGSPQQIADVVAYIGQLNPPVRTSVGSGEWVHRGEHLYGALCRTCHGAEGEGSAARFVPRLAGQRYDYLLRQLHDVVDGRRPSMASIHVRALRRLDAQELDGLADYMSRLSPGALRNVSR